MTKFRRLLYVLFHDAGKLAGHGGRYSYVLDNPDEKHLRIENVTLDDDGLFECQMMRQGLGGFRTSAYVTVLVPPKGVAIQNNVPDAVISVVEGSDLDLSCVAADGKPHAVVSWRSDSGTVLTCEAVHPPTSAHFRANVTLDVLYPSGIPKIELLNGPGLIKPGDNVTMICSVIGGNPPPRLLWLFHQNPVSSNYSYDTFSKKTVNAYSMVIDANDNGAIYDCQSTNLAGGEPLSTSIRLSVSYAPHRVEISGETTTRLERPVTVQCRTGLSNPASTVSWLINGQPYQSGSDAFLEQSTGTVTVSNLTVYPTDVTVMKHQITVQCVAKNDEGMTSKQLVIRVLSPPMEPVIYGIEGITPLEGETLNLTCESHGGNPLAMLTWFRGIEKVFFEDLFRCTVFCRKVSADFLFFLLRFTKLVRLTDFCEFSQEIQADFQLRETRSTVSGDVSRSAVSLVLDRTINNQQLRCEARNGALDEPLVAVQTINVLFPPRRVTLRPDDRNRRQIIAGEVTKLICLVHSSNPIAEVTWDFQDTENGATVSFNEIHSNRSNREYGGYEVDSVVEFVPTEAMHGKEVRCTASHPQWTEQKVVTYPLNVLYAPRVMINGPLTVEVGEGDHFTENLTVHANPMVSTWRWRKDGTSFDYMIGAITAR
ncbi:unnamed protein product, partial [Gongylonema pulchrum]|uniref:Nephrin n=1 Tax=Gongylonema pulchrum TaxID=637853 RepID=A0A183E8Y2_9BILA